MGAINPIECGIALEWTNRHPDEEFKYYRVYMLTPS